jgi:hypothetical protein
MSGLPHVLAVGLLVTGLSGCTLLDLLLGSSPLGPDETFPPFPFPSATAIYSTGRATIELDGETLVLDRLLPGAAAQTEYGSHVVWTNGTGLYLSYSSVEDLGLPGESSFLSLDRIVDHQHWVIADPFRCVTTTTQSDASGLTGTAVCRGLTWTDWFGSYMTSDFPQPIPSLAPFDADVTFEAH